MANEVVTVIRQCLDAPYVAVEVGARDASPVLVEHGVPTRAMLTYLMVHRGEQVGRLLQKLKDLGVADNTIVVYSTDNGNELMMWPDGGYAPFRGEKGTTWEGGVRVPLLIS